MRYVSTRGTAAPVSAAEAIKKGIAPDGGLYVPESVKRLTPDEISALAPLNYRERAVRILSLFLTDFSEAEIRDCVEGAYGPDRFDKGDPVPLVRLNSHLHVMELWHGPTCAFKDMALQILPRFMVHAMRKTGENAEIVILVATSGDTGKAALEGFRDVDGTRVIVFYPKDGVSEVQRRQMLTQAGRNVHVVGVDGNFDDAQTGVKQIFGDAAFNAEMEKSGLKFSSANSINWGRLVPQIVYYFSAYADLLKAGTIRQGDKANFVVPTGNFGNILAAWYAMEMGLPVGRLICASNDNNVLADFLRTGVYDRRRDFVKTVSPSMDILVSSNLERLLYEVSGHDGLKVSGFMSSLASKGFYEIPPDAKARIARVFWGGWSTTAETLKTIDTVYRETGYVLDTHTAVAMDVYDKYGVTTGDLTPTVIVSTASPFKFNASVAGALFGESAISGMDEFALLGWLSEKTGWEVPVGLRDLDKRDVLHHHTCGRDGMADTVAGLLGLPVSGRKG